MPVWKAQVMFLWVNDEGLMIFKEKKVQHIGCIKEEFEKTPY